MAHILNIASCCAEPPSLRTTGVDTSTVKNSKITGLSTRAPQKWKNVPLCIAHIISRCPWSRLALML